MVQEFARVAVGFAVVLMFFGVLYLIGNFTLFEVFLLLVASYSLGYLVVAIFEYVVDNFFV